MPWYALRLAIIVISDSYYIPKRIVELADFTITSRCNKNFAYHGNPEIELIKDGLGILNKYDTEYHYRITYDFIMNEEKGNGEEMFEGYAYDDVDEVNPDDFNDDNENDLNQLKQKHGIKFRKDFEGDDDEFVDYL